MSYTISLQPSLSIENIKFHNYILDYKFLDKFKAPRSLLEENDFKLLECISFINEKLRTILIVNKKAEVGIPIRAYVLMENLDNSWEIKKSNFNIILYSDNFFEYLEYKKEMVTTVYRNYIKEPIKDYQDIKEGLYIMN